MSGERQIKELIKKIAGQTPEHVFTATVKTVSGNECTVMYGDLEISGVKLFASTDGKLLISPKKDTSVLIADLSQGELRDLTVIRVDEPDKIQYKCGDLTFEAADNKFDISSGSVSVKSLLLDLASILKAFKVMCTAPNSLSSDIDPTALTKIEKFEVDTKKLLK